MSEGNAELGEPNRVGPGGTVSHVGRGQVSE